MPPLLTSVHHSQLHNLRSQSLDVIPNHAPLPDPFSQDYRCDDVVVCVVCGGICKPTVYSSLAVHDPYLRRDWMHPTLIRAQKGFLEWCKQPHTATAYRRRDDKVLHAIPITQFRGGPDGFYAEGLGKLVINTADAEMNLPIHARCIDLALIFCRYQSRFSINFRAFSTPEGGIPSSIAHLYEIWMKRALMTNPGLLGPLHQPIDEPNNYFGAVVTQKLYEYRWTLSHDNYNIALQEADPGPSSLYTTHVVMLRSHPLPRDVRPDPKYETLWETIEKQPPEIRNRIMESLEPFDDLGIEETRCTRIAPPSWWKARLFSHDLHPWLYDLDEACLRTVCVSTGNSLPLSPQMDWERLCRDMAQPNVCKPGGALFGHAGLSNRHRIWRLLNSARLGHFSSPGSSTCFT
ncbi:uncharacterized protein F4822DRAFT_146491 [Hypoxylon trugodes]|uniref:uncharacterized protein n=1 Tax=Hypoxylon trugodes TaxID=326681 RepID=UPI00218FC817|nr:uncharacterized protein F4822DRAFT_146491 [Hypoxylon trugodes]KAI1392932.1 hypothetical protein F4822DRAFT_146491 [Hypoxylon trugodes]